MNINKILTVLTVAIILSLTSCGVTKKYEQTKATNSITAYEDYLAKYPKGKYNNIARQEVAVLYEERDWKNAKNHHTIANYNDFISKYPDSKFTSQADERIAELEEQQAWDKAINLNSIDGFENFLSIYPDSNHAFDAKNKIKKLIEERAWNEAERIGTTAAYRKFILDFPHGDYYSKSEEKLKELEYQKWSNAKQENTVKSYESYLSDFPDGEFSEEAEKKIIDLEVDEIFKGDYGKLPPMNESTSGYGYYQTTSEIKVFNNTQYSLTLRYSGPESKKVVFNPQQKKTITLNKGKYRVAASVNISSINNYAGTEEIIGGMTYDVQYYIKTVYF